MNWKVLWRYKWFSKISLLIVLELLVLVVADKPLKPTADVHIITAPTPENLPGANLTPEELAAIDINEAMRDRLRSDPALLPILNTVRRDLMAMKWGGARSETPGWEKYGAKAFPLLDYYTQSSDPVRQQYGMSGIRSLGKPYTTLWLKTQIQRQTHSPIDWDVDAPPLAEFGLDDPHVRQEIIRLAQENLEPKTAPQYHSQFNLVLLQSLVGYNSAYPTPLPDNQDTARAEKTYQELSQWRQWNTLKQLDQRQAQQVLPYYHRLSISGKYFVKRSLFQAPQGKLSPVEQVLAKGLMADETSPDRIWAIAWLDWHGDAAASEQLVEILNGDLRQLNSVARLSRKQEIYVLLQHITKKYPQSRFTQGCQEYSDLTGYEYVGREPRSKAIRQQLERKSPAQKVADWQDWLNRYPDHPGADDATDRLARSLLENGDAVEATRLWISLMTQSVGDGDTYQRGYPRLRVMLDVGLFTDQIQALLQAPEATPITPLLRYALAVNFARDQDYASALQTSEGLNLNQIPAWTLKRYYQVFWWWDKPGWFNKVPQQMQDMLTEQRGRWRQLLQWQQENTAESRYRIASNWADSDGWKNGYLAVWNGNRREHLPTTYIDFIQVDKEHSEDYYASLNACRYWWVCDLARRGETTVQKAYQRSSSNAIALSLYQQLLNDAQTPVPIREKTLYMVAMTLLCQWENLSLGETQRIHPPAGVIASDKEKVQVHYLENKSYRLVFAITRDYQHRIDGIITELQQKFPQSSYIDDLLFSSYHLSSDRRYLEKLVKQYPQGDRAEEAKFLLNQPKD